MNRTVLSVTQINRYIKDVLENDMVLQSLFVQGEISNFKRHSSGHCYFSLKDAMGTIACVMFRGDAEIIPFDIENGMDVILYGRISSYEKTGQYQLYVEFVEPVGVGALQLAFEQLKGKLNREGLFDPDFKREIPENITTVAVVTSPTGAVIRDIIKVVKRRDNRVNIAIFPTLVQGDTAKDSIAQAIKDANDWGKADVLVVARGGGSMEDLWCFNEEVVARAIFASEIPVISAVGHETDFTISDFVSDVRASTPSVAGELITSPIIEKLEYVEFLNIQLYKILCQIYQEKYSRFLYFEEKINLNSPIKKIKEENDRLINFNNRLQYIIKLKLDNSVKELNFLSTRLDNASPLNTLKRGYAIVSDLDGKGISSVTQIAKNDEISVRLQDGEILVNVQKIKIDKKK